MGLKQSIIVKNQYTHNNVNTPGKGSRGGTPGNYVLQYMARLEATEVLSPASFYDPETPLYDYSTRYMLREEATEALKDDSLVNVSVEKLKQDFRDIDALTGRAFGNRGASLSDQTVRDSSTKIQKAFDEGHAVQKIILSFDEEFLKENGVVDKDYQHNGRGSYKGHVDQLKLRLAVINGVDKMTKLGQYADPEWVGVIQLDTNHIHAHIALVDKDFSPSRMVDDTHDKGKLTQREINKMRRGIQSGLNDMKTIKSFQQSAAIERRNVISFVKDYSFDQAKDHGRMQVILAALPEKKHHWRYRTNRRDMKRANELATNYVTQLFEDEPVKSGYLSAIQAVERYAKERQSNEDLTPNEQTKLIKNGKELIVERSVNGLYQSLKGFDKNTLPIQTATIDMQSASQDQLLSQIDKHHSEPVSDEGVDFDPAGFELRVRGYGKRLNHHAGKSQEYKMLIHTFDETNAVSPVAPEAFMLRRFYEEELQWNMGLTDKYRSFFTLNGRDDRLAKEKHVPSYEALLERYTNLTKQSAFLTDVDEGTALTDWPDLTDDFSLNHVFAYSDSINAHIKEKYGVDQGSRVYSSFYREGLEDELDNDKALYVEDLREYTFNCFVDGVSTQQNWMDLQPPHRDVSSREYEYNVNHKATVFQPPKLPQTRDEGISPRHFDNVKALDIHHLNVDYYGKEDRSIKDRFKDIFTETMRWREYFVKQAKEFLHKTNQRFRAQALDDVIEDVSDMRDCAVKLVQDGLIPTIDPVQIDGSDKRNTKTIRLDTGVDVLPAVQHELHQVTPYEIAQQQDQRDQVQTQVKVQIEPNSPNVHQVTPQEVIQQQDEREQVQTHIEPSTHELSGPG